VFFKEGGEMFVVDYSRMPWGEPGFDVGFWVSQYLLNYHKYKNDYFRKLGQLFLDKYVERTGDKEIVKTMVYSLGLISVMYSSSTWVPGIDDGVRKSFYEHITEMLKRKEFFW